MNKSWILAGVFALGLVGVSYAQETKEEEKRENLDEIVIDSRFKIKKENSGKIVHKITPAVIEQNKGKTIVDLINRVSGIEINGSTSVQGQNLGLFVRGGRSNEVVILIDGLQVVDPLQNSFDLRFIDLEQVESIEINKGASSTLYGSGAATAVIDIRMKKGKEGGFNATVGSFVGTNQTAINDNVGSLIQTNVGVNGRDGKINYLINYSFYEASGISAARDEVGNDAFDDDPFRRNNLDIRLGVDFSEKFSLAGAFTTSRFKNSFDADSFTEGDNRTLEDNFRISLSPEFRYGNGTVNINMAYTKFDIDRVNTSFPGKSDGDNYMVDAFVKHNFGKVKLIGGINFQSNEIRTFSIPFGATELTETQFAQDPKTTITDPYANIVYISETGFNLNAGVRWNNHSIYGNNFVYNFNPSYRISNENGYFRFFGSFSSAFVAPSIQELFSSFGNPELEAQESTTLEFGAEFKRNNFTVNAVYFNRDIDNIIIFDPVAFILVNGGDTKVSGIEVNSSFDILKDLSVNANYTYTNNDDPALRIPESKANIGLAYQLSEDTNFTLDYQFVSDRDDQDFRNFLNVQDVTLEGYSLLDFGARHVLTKGITVFGNVSNILNEDYQEIFGFSTRGRNYRLGLRFEF
jgi:vitamin B12 transporter